MVFQGNDKTMKKSISKREDLNFDPSLKTHSQSLSSAILIKREDYFLYILNCKFTKWV